MVGQGAPCPTLAGISIYYSTFLKRECFLSRRDTAIVLLRSRSMAFLNARPNNPRAFQNWMFLLPTLIFFIAYQIYPIIRVFWISLTDYRYLSQDPVQWVGLQNYINALSDPVLYDGLLRAIKFTALFLPGIIIPLFLAVMI